MAKVPIYSWGDAKLPGVRPLVFVAVREDPRAEADRVKGLAAGGDCPPLLLRNSGDRGFLKVPILDALTGRYGDQLTAGWVSEFFGRLCSLELCPPFVALNDDKPSGPHSWALNFDGGGKARYDLLPKNKLPIEIRALKSSEIFDWPYGDHSALNAYNRFVHGQIQTAMDHAFKRPMLAAMGQPAVGGPDPLMGNYGDVSGYGLTDANGWPIPVGTLGVSCPVCYLAGGGQKYTNAGVDPIDGRIADALQQVKACVAATGKVYPWIDFPSHGGPDAASKWVGHIQALRAGRPDGFLFFNPLPLSSEDVKLFQQAFE